MPANDRVSTKIVVPGAHSMVSLLGSRDELLTVIPAPADSPPPVSTASPSPIGALESPSPEVTAAAVTRQSARPAAATSGTSRTTRLIELLVVAAVLLGIGGGYGLWVTSEKR